MSRSRTSRKDRGDERGRARSQSTSIPRLSDQSWRIVLSLLLEQPRSRYTRRCLVIRLWCWTITTTSPQISMSGRGDLEHGEMGIYRVHGSQLASPDLVVARPRLPVIRFESGPASSAQCAPSRAQGSPAVSVAREDDQASRAEPAGSGFICLPSSECGIGRVVAEQKNVLSTLFFFLAIAAYRWYADAPGWRRYLLVASLFAAGLMAKPMVDHAAVCIDVLDYWPLNRVRTDGTAAPSPLQFPPSKLLLEKLPLLALSAASAVVTVKAQHAGRAVRSLHQFPSPCGWKMPLFPTPCIWRKCFGRPTLLSTPFPRLRFRYGNGCLSASILIAITALTLRLHPQRYLLVGWLWFLGTLVPVIGLVQVGDATMADRYAYLPLIGIFIAITWGATALCDKWKVNSLARVIAAICVVIALAAVTVRQMSYWKNEVDLWSHVLAVSENNPFAHDALGAVLMDPEIALSSQGKDNLDSDEVRMEKARRHLELALAERRQLAQQNPATYLPDMADTLNNLAI